MDGKNFEITENNVKEYVNKISTWIRKQVQSANAKGVVLGMSGGKDSFVVAKLCCEAIGKQNVFGIIMPKGEMLDIDNGWIEFLDNNADGVCELVKISEYYNMVVESVTDKKIYDKFNDRSNVVLEDSDIRIFDELRSTYEN